MSTVIADEFQSFDQRAVIKVCGIGGGGGNAVSRMMESGLSDVEFIAINTDAQALKNSPAGVRLQIGSGLTEGLGAGAQREVGRKAAEEDRERIREVIEDAHMVFLTAGLGGGTGTGAAPIVAEIAKNADALTVAICTLPFSFEGPERMQNALTGLKELEQFVDTLIVVPNDRVATLCQHKFTLMEAFHMADEVLDNGVRAITELITVTGLINLDFADLRTIMKSKGRALMGIGVAEGENRAIHAAQEAIVCPLLEQSNINGATGVIVNIKGGRDITMREIEEAVNTVKKSGAANANIIFGVVVDREKEHSEITVTVIAAGFQKGVSEDFLSTDGKDTYETAMATTFDFPDPETPGAADAEAAFAALEKSALAPPPDDPDPIPGQAELFPDKNEDIDCDTAVEEEDLGIPAFLRRRMKKRH